MTDLARNSPCNKSPLSRFNSRENSGIKVLIQVGSGKFGGAKTSPHEKKVEDTPKRDPDAVMEEKTSVDQAIEHESSAKSKARFRLLSIEWDLAISIRSTSILTSLRCPDSKVTNVCER